MTSYNLIQEPSSEETAQWKSCLNDLQRRYCSTVRSAPKGLNNEKLHLRKLIDEALAIQGVPVSEDVVSIVDTFNQSLTALQRGV